MSSAGEEKKKSLSVFKVLRRAAPMLVKAFPFSYLATALMALAHGASWGLTAPLNQRLYDALADAATGRGAISAIYLSAAFVTALMLGQQLLNAVHNFFEGDVLHRKALRVTYLAIYKKAERLPAQVFEDKEKLDDIEKAHGGSDSAIWMMATMSDLVFFYGTYYAVMGLYLWRMKPMLAVALLFIFIPVALSQVVRAKLYAKLEEESAPVRRQNGHYAGCLTGAGMKETRLFGAYKFFMGLYMDTLHLLAQKEWTVQKKITAIDLGLSFLKAAGWLGVMLLLLDALRAGDISVGAFAAVFSSIGMLFSMLEEIFGRIKWSVTDNLGKMHNYVNFLDIPDPVSEPAQVDFARGVVADNIRFTYPKGEKPAVDGVSLTIREGETVAIVGENGCGKTTLVKLLSGLFAPESGKVTVGGCDTARADGRALFAQTSAVFQNFGWYSLTLEENVRMSDHASGADVAPVLTHADVHPDDEATFPKGLDTMLSREYGGVQLSGGQWQRVAIARGLYRRHVFILLDEPTAAIDPLEETKVYKRFAAFSKGKTAVLVTHRLGSARIADRILVMDAGKIVESGTHDQLRQAGGKYAEMWASQAGNYEEEAVG